MVWLPLAFLRDPNLEDRAHRNGYTLLELAEPQLRGPLFRSNLGELNDDFDVLCTSAQGLSKVLRTFPPGY